MPEIRGERRLTQLHVAGKRGYYELPEHAFDEDDSFDAFDRHLIQWRASPVSVGGIDCIRHLEKSASGCMFRLSLYFSLVQSP
jgi:hypothetical protein